MKQTWSNMNPDSQHNVQADSQRRPQVPQRSSAGQPVISFDDFSRYFDAEILRQEKEYGNEYRGE